MAIPRGWDLMEQPDARYIWNPVKRRHENWVRVLGGEFILVDGNPIDVSHDNFISPLLTMSPALYGIRSQLQWSVTGRPNPTGSNFAQINELGGGMELRTRPTNGRWIAMHYGDIYPLIMTDSPHTYLRWNYSNLANMHCHIGLAGEAGKPGNGDPHTLSDDAIWFEYDSAEDANVRSVTRSGGAETSKILMAADTDHHNYCVRVTDDGDEVEFLVDGVLLQTHVAGEDLPTGVQLQPYWELETLTNAVRSVDLHHYIQLFDALWV